MTDPLTEIEARLEAAKTLGRWPPAQRCGRSKAEFITHCPEDIRWLVEEVKRLRALALEMRLAGIDDGIAIAEAGHD